MSREEGGARPGQDGTGKTWPSAPAGPAGLGQERLSSSAPPWPAWPESPGRPKRQAPPTGGMAERVRAISGSPVDLVLDTAPAGGALPGLVQIADGDPKSVLTISHFQAVEELGVRDSFKGPTTRGARFDVFPEFAQLAADGKFTVPIAGTFPYKTGAPPWKSASAATPAANSCCCPKAQTIKVPAVVQVGPAPLAKAPSQNELTASRMCWPGLALVFRSSSSSQASPTCCETASAARPGREPASWHGPTGSAVSAMTAGCPGLTVVQKNPRLGRSRATASMISSAVVSASAASSASALSVG